MLGHILVTKIIFPTLISQINNPLCQKYLYILNENLKVYFYDYFATNWKLINFPEITLWKDSTITFRHTLHSHWKLWLRNLIREWNFINQRSKYSQFGIRSLISKNQFLNFIKHSQFYATTVMKTQAFIYKYALNKPFLINLWFGGWINCLSPQNQLD